MTNPRSAIALATGTLLLFTGCGGSQTSRTGVGTNASASPPQLRSIQELRSAFNAPSREPTLIVLVAPT